MKEEDCDASTLTSFLRYGGVGQGKGTCRDREWTLEVGWGSFAVRDWRVLCVESILGVDRTNGKMVPACLLFVCWSTVTQKPTPPFLQILKRSLQMEKSEVGWQYGKFKKGKEKKTHTGSWHLLFLCVLSYRSGLSHRWPGEVGSSPCTAWEGLNGLGQDPL